MNLESFDILNLPRLNLHGRQLYDLEILLVGGFSPVSGFMNENDYEQVVETMRLEDGTLFPTPIVLDIPNDVLFKVGERIILCDQFGNPLATLDIESRFNPDKDKESLCVYGTNDLLHPGVEYLINHMSDTYLGGRVTKISLPVYHDFKQFRHTPDELKAFFKESGWEKVIGFQTRNPMHKAHFELIKRAYEKIKAPVLVHPVVGMTKSGDIDYTTRVHTYNAVCNIYGKDFTHLSLLPLSMRMAGPREAVWHAIIRKNYGCTHFIVGRDHAGPGKGSDGKDFYGSYEARDLANKYADEIGITIVTSDELMYSNTRKSYVTSEEINEEDEIENISGTEFRRRLIEEEDIPDWFSFKECIDILRDNTKKDTRQGLTIFFTGLSCSGKTTLAQILISRLQEIQDKNITFLDGDIVRANLSKELGFSKSDRDENIRRVGFVAGEIVRHGGIVICALIAPYSEARKIARNFSERYGRFIEIFVNTPIDECARRDTKGLYMKARKGIIKNFTGVDDPYEIPNKPEIILNTEENTPDELVDKIITYLKASQALDTKF